MNHTEAKSVIENLKRRGASVEFTQGQVDVRLEGFFNIKELHAVLQIMEYGA